MSTEHDERMLKLLMHNSIRKLKLDIVKLSRENLEDELTYLQCNPSGGTVILRERLLRAILKESKYEHLVPWYEFDETPQFRDNAEDEINQITTSEIPNIMDSIIPNDTRNKKDDALSREMEYEEMRRSRRRHRCN